MQIVTVRGIDIEVQLRYRLEIRQWQATMRHPTLGFTVSEWADTAGDATNAARRAMLLYEGEMMRVLSGPSRLNHPHPALALLRTPGTKQHDS